MTLHLTTTYVPIHRLLPHADNPRRGDLRAIQESIRRHGIYRPVVVNRPTMEVLAGNHVVHAAKGLGYSEIAATFVDVDSEQARRILLVDNRTSDLATYDTQELVDLLAGLDGLEGTGFDDDAFGALLDEVAPAPV